MIPVLRSIDHLLNQFDQLSKCHEHMLINFRKDFPEVESPLRNVARNEEEQRKTAARILLVIEENDEQKGSIQTLEDFHRRTIKNRYLHRPPIYYSNDPRGPSRTSSTSTESRPISKTSQTSTLPSSISHHRTPEPKVKLPSLPRRPARSTRTVFTMETVNRLSKPKVHHQSPTSKCVHLYKSKKNEASECSTSSIKRSTVLPPLKKIKRDPSRTLVSLAPTPVVQLTFPSVFHPQTSMASSYKRLISP